MRYHGSLVVVLFSLALSIPAEAQDRGGFNRGRRAQDAAAPRSGTFRPEHVSDIPWRQLGPANMGGRITDFEVCGKYNNTWYAASASGGVFKTTNAGTTWTPLFRNQTSISVGDVAVAPSNNDIVWVGTGEENGRNSVSWGDGVYKSTDGGKTFKHMGLKESFQIGHIAIHPSNPNVVYVAALGKLWGDNEERGVFRTSNGGASWQKVLYLDEKTGCIDIRIDPRKPDVVYAAMYERRRDMFDGNDPIVRFGAKAGLFRSDDGGDNWKRLTNGLPTCKYGRIGLTLSGKSRSTLFAVIETERSGWASGESRTERRGIGYLGVGHEAIEGKEGARVVELREDGPAGKAGLKVGDVLVRFADRKITDGDVLSAAIRRRYSGDKVKVAVLRAGREEELEVTLGTRPANLPQDQPAGAGRGRGGRGARGGRGRGGRGRGGRGFGGRLGGQRENVQDRQGNNAHETGGVYRSDDYGETWTRLNSITPRPFYFSIITVDPNNDDTLYVCGIQLWKSTNNGRTFRQINRQIHVDFHGLWVDPLDSNRVIALCDGGVNVSHDGSRTWEVMNNFAAGQFYRVGLDTSKPYNVYGGLQDNGTWGGPVRTRFTDGVTVDEWFKIYSGDGFGASIDPENPHIVFATSQGGNIGMVNLRTGGQQRVQKPRAQGGGRARFNWDTPFFLSPHNPKILFFAGSYAYRSLNRGRNTKIVSDRLGLTNRGTGTAMAQSPRDEDILFVGTDDGALWRTTDGGVKWEELHKKLPGLPGPRYVSHIQLSHHNTDRVFVTLDPHRSNDFETYIYASDDLGDTWRPITKGIKGECAHVIVEDPQNRNLLFCGTEYSCYASLDRGQQWYRLGKGLHTVPVRDLKIQNEFADLVAATHGSGMWVVDIEPLRQLTAQTAGKEAHLFKPHDAILWQRISRSSSGHKKWRAPKAHTGAEFYLYLNKVPEKAPVITVHDLTGKEVGRVTGKNVAGVQTLRWNATTTPTRGAFGGRGARGARGRGARGARGARGDTRGARGGGRGARGARGGRRGAASLPRGAAGRGGFRGRGRGRPLPPGDYTVKFEWNGNTQMQALRLLPDPISKNPDTSKHPHPHGKN